MTNETRSCLNCDTDISAMRKNAKFCSNSGENNCKDSYNNKISPRGFGARKAALKANDEKLEEAIKQINS